jgi:hypothetical protein
VIDVRVRTGVSAAWSVPTDAVQLDAAAGTHRVAGACASAGDVPCDLFVVQEKDLTQNILDDEAIKRLSLQLVPPV